MHEGNWRTIRASISTEFIMTPNVRKDGYC